MAEPQDEARGAGARECVLEPDPRASPVGLRAETDPLVEAEAVAGHGPETTVEIQTERVPPARGVAALRYRDFRLYWAGQVVSLTGTWMQIVGQSWLVLELTESAFILGGLLALQFLPILTLSVLGGVVADRLPRRSILLATQSAALALAFAQAALTQTGLITIALVMILAFLLGLVNAVDMPTRQAFVVQLVCPEDLPNAIALNSAAFNSARLIGPALAGLAIGLVGIPGAFFLNGLSYLAVIGALLVIEAGRQRTTRGARPGAVWDNLRDGFNYVTRTPVVWLIILLVALVAAFGLNLGVLVPVYTREVLGLGATGFGLLTSAAGGGSLVAALSLALSGATPRAELLLGAAVVLGAAEIAVGASQEFALAMVLLAVAGFAGVFFTTSSNTVLQTTVPDELRGRVMSLYTTVFAGTTPFGSLIIGGLAETRGVRAAFLVAGATSVAAVGLVYLLGRSRRP